MLSNYYGSSANGRHKLLEVETVKNGWLVTYYPKPEDQILPTIEEMQKKQQEVEKEHIARSLKEQAASIKLAGEAMLKARESWQDSEEDESDNFQKIDEIAGKIAEMHPTTTSRKSPFFGAVAAAFPVNFPKGPESVIFTNKEDLLKFLASCV